MWAQAREDAELHDKIAVFGSTSDKAVLQNLDCAVLVAPCTPKHSSASTLAKFGSVLELLRRDFVGAGANQGNGFLQFHARVGP